MARHQLGGAKGDDRLSRHAVERPKAADCREADEQNVTPPLAHVIHSKDQFRDFWYAAKSQ
jgi:hypothetical protein